MFNDFVPKIVPFMR